ncbi:hypothetical protein YC2023_016266 [Brassica napus]
MELHVLLLRDLKLGSTQPAQFTMGSFWFELSSSGAIWSLGIIMTKLGER